MPADMRRAWAAGADLLVAADAGADRLLEAGLEPHVLIGDLDSVAPSTLLATHTIVDDRDPDRTDCEKCLRFCETTHPESEVLIICAEGDQFDHEIATLIAAASSSASPAIAFRRGLCIPLGPLMGLTCQLEPGARVSLLPILPCTGVSLSGVQWPLSDASLSAAGLISISNKALGTVQTSLTTGRASLFVEVPIGTWPSEVGRFSC